MTYILEKYRGEQLNSLQTERSTIRRTIKGMWTDKTRNAKIKGDQIEVFKILNGYENIDSNIVFEIRESKITRGHNYTLVKKQSRLDVRKYYFHRVPSMYGITYQLIVYMLVC